jgi:predicted ester cyclase
MMNKEDLVKKFFADLEASDPRTIKHYFTDDFKFSGPVPEPTDADGFIEAMTGLKRGFPDWKFNVRDIKEASGNVTCSVQITGTHTKELKVMDLPSVPPTGKKINIPKEPMTLFFRGDKISECRVQKVPGGGVLGAYKQVGVDLTKPVHA